MEELIKINDLHVEVEGKEILKGLNLTIKPGEIHVIMGPNGAGKSTLASSIMGHPKYEVTSGEILFEGESLEEVSVTERARKGIFLSFQYPEEINGVTIENFIRSAKMARSTEPVRLVAFRKALEEKMEELSISKEYRDRYLNVGFSGGEKKKSEVLQMAMLQPKLAMLDETDSGLDVDATKIVSEGILKVANENNAFLIVTHHNHMLQEIKPDYVHVLVAGTIVKTGGMEIVKDIEANGYGKYLQKEGVNLWEQ